MPIEEVKAFIKKHGHLQGVSSEKEVLEDGLNLGEMSYQQQIKIEELYLYMFQLDERLKSVEGENEILKKENNELKKVQGKK
ncbi:MAG: hypothetical protein H0X62_13710 [Bacteroidetes bacterium]|nr:hypothetical protein [Bacteroidota bacterium]